MRAVVFSRHGIIFVGSRFGRRGFLGIVSCQRSSIQPLDVRTALRMSTPQLGNTHAVATFFDKDRTDQHGSIMGMVNSDQAFLSSRAIRRRSLDAVEKKSTQGFDKSLSLDLARNVPDRQSMDP